jgi:hypothetical protein
MRLIGPTDVLSWGSITFYFAHLWKTMLFLAAPFLLLGIRRPPRLRSLLAHTADRQGVLLWMWLLGPLTLLILEPVKEPRHVAPCIVPAVLLIVRGIERLERVAARRGLLAALIAAAACNYALATCGVVSCPYYLNEPTHAADIENSMLLEEPEFEQAIQRGYTIMDHWRFAHNIVIAGFEENMALAINWSLFPAVVYDADVLEPGAGRRTDGAYEDFEDLSTLVGFDLYNRRCKWFEYMRTLDRNTVFSNADYVICKRDAADRLAGDLRSHEHCATIASDSGDIRIFKRKRRGITPYRILYAQEYLRQGRNRGMPELNAIHFEMFMTLLLQPTPSDVHGLLGAFPPGFTPTGEMKHIYTQSAVYERLYGPRFPTYLQYIQQVQLDGDARTSRQWTAGEDGELTYA